MNVRQVVRYASLVVPIVIAVSTATAQLRSADVYMVGDDKKKVVIIERFVTADGSQLAVHNLKLFRNKLDSVVFKIFSGSAEITSEVAKTPNYQIMLKDGESLIFVSGTYDENGKPQRLTRVLPKTWTNWVNPAPKGGLLVTDGFSDSDGKTVEVAKRYSIDQNGELDWVVVLIKRAGQDITSEVAKTPNYQIMLKDGESLVFVSGTYDENGKPQRLTRVLPKTWTNWVNPAPKGGLLVTDGFTDSDNKTAVLVVKKYTIGRNGELRHTVQSVRRGEADLTPSILSGECKSVPIKGGDLQFHVVTSPKEGSQTITVTRR